MIKNFQYINKITSKNNIGKMLKKYLSPADRDREYDRRRRAEIHGYFDKNFVPNIEKAGLDNTYNIVS